MNNRAKLAGAAAGVACRAIRMRTDISRVRKAIFPALALGTLFLAAAVQGATYPSPTPDFAHPATPHASQLTPASGANSRPLLVIVTLLDDVDEATASNAATYAQTFFGPSGVNDFFRASSFGKFGVTPAAESSGTANDGVVVVDMNMTMAEVNEGGEEKRGRRAIVAADPWVNYASFNRNGDDKIGDDELLIMMIQEHETYNCGGTRLVENGAKLDNVDLGSGRQHSFGGSRFTNRITHIHELSHHAFDHADHDYIAGTLDVTGPTCSSTDDGFWDYNSWHKLHLGWKTPTVVVKDGYYTVSRWDETGQAYLLYDPDRGTNDYFLVENRTKTAGSYDADAADRGLVIWRAEEGRFGMNGPRGAYQLIRPIGGLPPKSDPPYGGTAMDAWDPSDVINNTPQRAMTETWGDGTGAKVAVRAIGPASDTIRAYFDVRGPGVLVDPSAGITDVKMLQPNPVSFPVMNTGEATDTFAFTLTGLPSGWSVNAPTQSLGAAATGTATVQLTVPGNTPTGNYTLQAKGTSTSDGSVTSSAHITVNVVKRATTLVYSGSSTADYSDSAAVSAVLTDSATGQPIAGKTVGFELGTQSTSPDDPTTDATGTASDSITITQASGLSSVKSSFAEDGTYLASSVTSAFTITKETLSFAYTGSTLLGLGTTPTLSSAATQESDGYPGDLSLADATFTLAPTLTAAPFSYGTGVDATGGSTIMATGLPVDIWSVTVAVPSTNAYWEGSTATASELVLFDPAAKFTGDAAGRDSANARVTVKFDVRYDSRVRPRGSVSVRFSGGSFSGKDPAWIVHVGNVAIFQQVGTLNGAPATLRMRVDDNAEPARPDTFAIKIGAYNSGITAVTSGNLQSHPTQ